MTPDNHIAGLDSLPQHVLLDRQVWARPWLLGRAGLEVVHDCVSVSNLQLAQ
jgi:hypothetical protein